MIIVVAISPIVLVALFVVIALTAHAGAGTIIALAAIAGGSLIISLAICAVISSKMSPAVRRDPEWTYTRNQVYRTEAPPSISEPAPTAILLSRETSAIEPPRTYKRMVGRRVVEYDMATHQPIRRFPR